MAWVLKVLLLLSSLLILLLWYKYTDQYWIGSQFECLKCKPTARLVGLPKEKVKKFSNRSNIRPAWTWLLVNTQSLEKKWTKLDANQIIISIASFLHHHPARLSKSINQLHWCLWLIIFTEDLSDLPEFPQPATHQVLHFQLVITGHTFTLAILPKRCHRCSTRFSKSSVSHLFVLPTIDTIGSALSISTRSGHQWDIFLNMQ